MLKKFKSKLFSARGAFEGGGASGGDDDNDEEEKAPPTTRAAEDEVGVAESHDQRGMTSEDAMKWCADHRHTLLLILRIP